MDKFNERQKGVKANNSSVQKVFMDKYVQKIKRENFPEK
jgi:hypothetical protein